MSEKTEALQHKLQALGPEASRERVDTLNALAWETGFSDVQRTAELAREATSLARELSYPGGIAWGLLNEAFRDYYVADFEAALAKAQESMALFEETGQRDGFANVLTGLGLVYWSLGDFERAVEVLHRGIAIFRELGNKEREAWGLTSLGGVLESIGDLDKAIECHEQALGKFRASTNRPGEGRALTGLGAALQRRGRLQEALEHYLASLELSRETKNLIGESRALNDIGTVYHARGELARAEDYLTQALELRRKIGNRPAEITSLLDLGGLSIDQGATARAHDLLQRALELATEFRTKPKTFRAHELLSRACEVSGDLKGALEHHRAFQRIKEEVLGEETATKLRNLQIKFESETLEKLKQAQAQIIQSEKMAVLGKLIAGIAHELNTPAGALRSASDTAGRALTSLEQAVSNSPARDQLLENVRYRAALEALSQHRETVSNAGQRLTEIVSNLTRFIHLDQAELKLADIHQGIQATLELLRPQWGDRIRVVKHFGDLPLVESYPAEINQVFMTLLTNAAEAIEGEGVITITSARANDHIRITTRDTGRGIPADRLDDIFDIGFTRKGGNIRLHVGLAHAKATVQKHHGDIRVHSTGDGTTFEISLPVRQR